MYRLLRLFYKSQSALTPLLILSKSQPLRWVVVWYRRNPLKRNGFKGFLFLALQFMLQLVKIFYDKEKMEKNIEKTTIKIQ